MVQPSHWGIGRCGSNCPICQSSAPYPLQTRKVNLDTPTPYDERANDSKIEAEVGENCEVSLPEARTAGYRW